MSTTVYPNDLIIVLAASETITVRSLTGRNLMIITMAPDEESCVVQTIPITQLAEGSDLGNTGYNYEAEPEGKLGLDHDLRQSPRSDMRGETR